MHEVANNLMEVLFLVNRRDNGIYEENFHKIIKEIKYLEKYKSPFIVDHISSWMESEECLCIQMELCEYDLQSIINMKNVLNPELNTIIYYISSEIYLEIVKCVQFLHSLKPPIIHGDLKPPNVLIKLNYLNENYIKLCDFDNAIEDKINSMAHTYGTSLTHTNIIGTPGYMAPEVINGSGYNTKADIYSLGIIAQNLFNKLEKYVIFVKISL